MRGAQINQMKRKQGGNRGYVGFRHKEVRLESSAGRDPQGVGMACPEVGRGTVPQCPGFAQPGGLRLVLGWDPLRLWGGKGARDLPTFISSPGQGTAMWSWVPGFWCSHEAAPHPVRMRAWVRARSRARPCVRACRTSAPSPPCAL